MSADLKSSCEVVPPSATSPGDDLPLFRFGLRQLLIFVSLISMLMAAMAIWHGLTALVLLLATLVIVFHVFSTALGTQLRWHANRVRRQDPPPKACEISAGSHQPATVQPQPRSPWHQRRSTPLPWLPRLVAAASLFGAMVGALLLSGMIGDRSSRAGVIVGSLSLGVIAGWFAFVGYSFYSVFRHGLRDAMSEDRREQPR